jgi:hypothetical protein
MTMAIVGVAAVGVGAAAGIGGALISANAAENAADTQAGAVRDANATQLRMFEQARSDLEPYRGYGRTALTNLERVANAPLSYPAYHPTPAYDPATNPYSPTPAYDPHANPYSPVPAYQGPSEADLRADPGYQFRVAEGQKALERSAAGKGLLLSGGQLKDLTRFGQDLGAQEYGAAYARGYAKNQDLYQRNLATNELDYGRDYAHNADVYGRTLATNQLDYGRGYQANADLYGRHLEAYQTGYNTLMGLRKEQYGEFAGIAGAGQGAVNTLASLGTQTGGQLAQTTIGAGNAQAAGQVGAANAWNAGLGSVAGAGNNYMQYQLLSQYLNRNAAQSPNMVGVQSDIYKDVINNPALY